MPRHRNLSFFSIFLFSPILFLLFLPGCSKKETPVIYFYCCELYWEAMWEETQLFKQLYNVDVVLIPSLPYSPKAETSESEKSSSETIPTNEEKSTVARRIPSPWRSRPKVRRFLSPDQLVLDHRLSGLISALADGRQYGDLYLSDSPEQLAELHRQSLASHEYPFCYLSMVLLVAAGNPHDIDSTETVLEKNLRLGIVSPSCYGMGSTAWDIISKTDTARTVRESTEEQLQESVIVYDHYPDLLAALERGEIDAALTWDVLIRQAEEFASVVSLGAESSTGDSDELSDSKPTSGFSGTEHRVVQQSLVSLRISNQEGYGRRFADFLISTQGQSILRKHGFIPKPL